MTTDAVRLDNRLREAGFPSVALLVRLWTEHTPPALPVPERCRTCGHFYSAEAPLCPTAAVVRPLLRRRRFEADTHGNLSRLTTNQTDDLLCAPKHLSTALTWRKDF
ncbi:hypothetical protein [Actinoplanes sp. NBRC 103695]|uniref:hypothetical protein n=1 Tax=Actinoplanes sp. NBRC 103695 TaxID=3032202 RepID=UPI0024A15231|nr:hypothetical protein [Actinoplanes sp. NBRC 103695]GLY97644.1 hypothetical protein Acsp02_48980 [Actinoplanes sp. NBRC 103695]